MTGRDDLRTETRTVALGGATTATALVTLGLGDLTVGGGASELLAAEFVYNVAAWRPDVAYDVDGAHGAVTVRQPASHDKPHGAIRYAWDLRFNDDVPLDLRLKLGVVKSNLRLGGLSLTGLAIEAGTGSATIDLRGDWQRDLRATIQGGVVNATLRLPDSVGVRVTVNGGILNVTTSGLHKTGADYVNAAYGVSPVTLRLAVQSGVGTIALVAEPASSGASEGVAGKHHARSVTR